MFYTKCNKFQFYNYSQTWQQNLREKQIAKNSYRALGDMKKAKAFVKNVLNYSPQIHNENLGEKIIFSLYDLAEIPLPIYCVR